MADYITKIRTADGDKQIDYNSLANLPDGEPFVEYVHSGNQELYIKSIDYTTGVITFTEPHGLTTSTHAMIVADVDPILGTNLTNRVKCFNGVPYEYRIANKEQLIPIDEYTATYCEVTSIDTTNKFNQSLDYTVWHFEIPIKWTIDNINLVKEVKNIDVCIRGYNDTGNWYLQEFFYMEDGTTTNMYIPIIADAVSTTNHKKPTYMYGIFKIKTRGNLLFTGLSELKLIRNHGTSHGYVGDGSFASNILGLHSYRLSCDPKNYKCVKSVGNFVGYFGIANGTVVEIYEGGTI